jgi:hypothetical protein
MPSIFAQCCRTASPATVGRARNRLRCAGARAAVSLAPLTHPWVSCWDPGGQVGRVAAPSRRVRAVRCSGRRNPNAMRVRTRRLVLVDSTMALDRLLRSPARMPGRFRRTRRARSTKAGSRERAAHRVDRLEHRYGVRVLGGGHRSQLLFQQVGPVQAPVHLRHQASLAVWRSVRSSGFSHIASQGPFRSRARARTLSGSTSEMRLHPPHRSVGRQPSRRPSADPTDGHKRKASR